MSKYIEEVIQQFRDIWGIKGTSPIYSDLGCTPEYKDVENFIKSTLQKQIEMIEGEVKKMYLDENPMDDGIPVETYGYEATHNQAIDDILSILNQYK